MTTNKESRWSRREFLGAVAAPSAAVSFPGALRGSRTTGRASRTCCSSCPTICAWKSAATTACFTRRRRTWTRSPNPACASTGITASSRSAIRRAPRCSPGAIRPGRVCLATARIFASRIPTGRRCRNCSRTTATSPCAPEKFITAALTTPNRGARPATRAARPTTAAARRLAKPW